MRTLKGDYCAVLPAPPRRPACAEPSAGSVLPRTQSGQRVGPAHPSSAAQGWGPADEGTQGGKPFMERGLDIQMVVFTCFIFGTVT